MKIKLKSLHLEQFKGVADKTYEFGDLTRISGMNRLGKTTIATAWYWLMADKDYELHSNPNIRPDNVEECIPTVTAVLDIDGKEVTIAKMQKRKVGKPDKDGISKVTLTNTYSVNEVPKTERDFKAYLEDCGLVFSNFLMCSHPDMFTRDMTSKDKIEKMRKMLFMMSCDKSDYDIASMSKETEDVAKLLVDYTAEEIDAMQKASKKKAVEQIDAIPNQIVGLEKAKADIDVAEWELAKADLERKIADIDKKIADAGSAVGDLMSEEMQLQFDMSGIKQTMNRELSEKRNSLKDDIYELNNDLASASSKAKHNEEKIADNKVSIESAEKKRSELGTDYKAELAKTFDETPYLFHEEEWQFDENSTICKSCGQTLPVEKIEQIKADFEQRKANAETKAKQELDYQRSKFDEQKKANMERIKSAGFEQKAIVEKLTADNEKLQAEIESLKKHEQEALEKKNELEKQLSEIPTEADYTQNAEYVKLKARHDEVTAQIESMKSSSDAADTFKDEKAELQAQLDDAKEKIAQASNNIRIDEQIEDLQDKRREYDQAKASAEKILYQLSVVSKKKNELLVEEINNHFGIVKWQLFDYQKNGEYKECCIPTVDGKRFGESTNTGREIEAKLDICNSFQKFFDMYLPVFLDGAESLNPCYMPKMDTQLITLAVSESPELKVEVG